MPARWGGIACLLREGVRRSSQSHTGKVPGSRQSSQLTLAAPRIPLASGCLTAHVSHAGLDVAWERRTPFPLTSAQEDAPSQANPPAKVRFPARARQRSMGLCKGVGKLSKRVKTSTASKFWSEPKAASGSKC